MSAKCGISRIFRSGITIVIRVQLFYETIHISVNQRLLNISGENTPNTQIVNNLFISMVNKNQCIL